MKAAFFDRDGVINKLIIEGTNYRSPRTIEEFQLNEGIITFVQILKSINYHPIIVTNQPEVKRGLVSRDMVELFHKIIQAEVGIFDFYVCWHDDYDNCNCRKPKPGLILQAINDYKINIHDSFMVGDTIKDLQAAGSINCKFYLYRPLGKNILASNIIYSSFEELISEINNNKNIKS